MATVCRFVLRAFMLVFVVALFLFLVGTFGWFGSPQDPLAGVFLVPLGLPWNLLTDGVPDPFRIILAAAAPLLEPCNPEGPVRALSPDRAQLNRGAQCCPRFAWSLSASLHWRCWMPCW